MVNTIPGRAALLLDRLRRKYRKIINAPPWTEEELAEIGPRLRASIIETMQEKLAINDRLAHIAVVAAS